MTMIHSCRLLEIIVLGSADTRIRHFRDNCFDVNFEFQIDAFTEAGGAGEGISAPGPVRRNPFLACRKGAAVPLLKRGPILKVSVIT